MTYKMWTVTLTIEKRTRNSEILTYKKDASLTADENCKFSEIIRFLDDVENIWKRAMKAKRSGRWYEIEITEMTEQSFDRWVSRYETDDPDLVSEGIYLEADTRYTAPERDMWLSKDVARDMSFTLR